VLTAPREAVHDVRGKVSRSREPLHTKLASLGGHVDGSSPFAKKSALMYGSRAEAAVPARDGHDSTGIRVSMHVSTGANRGA